VDKNKPKMKKPLSDAPVGDFWRGMRFEDLTVAQGVGPLTDIAALVGAWPGDVDDGFEDMICELRRAGRQYG